MEAGPRSLSPLCEMSPKSYSSMRQALSRRSRRAPSRHHPHRSRLSLAALVDTTTMPATQIPRIEWDRQPGSETVRTVAAALTLPGMAGPGDAVVEDSVRGGPSSGGPGRVAVVERSDAGAAVLREGAELANAGRELSVVTLAQTGAITTRGRAGGTGPYNVAMKEEAALELREARDILGSVASRASLRRAGRVPPAATGIVGGPAPLWARPASPPSAHPERQSLCEEPAQGDVGRGAGGQVGRAKAPRRPLFVDLAIANRCGLSTPSKATSA